MPSASRRRDPVPGLIALTSAFLLIATAAQAQSPAPPTVATPPAASGVPTGGARPDGGRGAALTARYHVRQMESVLERAVEHAADLMRRRLQAVTPDVLALAGAPRAQGFRIEGYGLFFSVEVPRLSESVNWALRVLSQDRDERVLASLQKLASAEQDPAVRADLERAMRTMQLQLAMAPPPTGAPQAAPAASRRLSTAPQEQAASPAGSTAQAPHAAADAAVAAMPDPSAVYEAEVKQSLVDAMLDYAGSLPLGGTEWVTVAARDAGYVAFPDAVSDMVTVTLSVRVSDLAEFRAQRLTRDEARARVVVREF